MKLVSNKEIRDLTNEEITKKIEEYKETLINLRGNEIKMQEQINSATTQLSLLERSLTSEQNNLRDTDSELFAEQKRDEEIREQIITLQDELAEIEYKGKKLTKELDEIEEEIAKCNKSVSGKTGTLDKKREEQNKYQEQ